MQPIYVLRGSGKAAIKPWILVLFAISFILAAIVSFVWEYGFLLFLLPILLIVLQTSKILSARARTVEIYDGRILGKEKKTKRFEYTYTRLYLIKRRQNKKGKQYNFGDITLLSPEHFSIELSSIGSLREAEEFFQNNQLLLNRYERESKRHF